MQMRHLITAVAVVYFLGNACLPVGASTPAWDMQIRALRLSEAGSYSEAAPLFRQAIQLEEAQPSRSWPYKLCLLRAVRNYVHMENYRDALPLLEKLSAMYENNRPTRDVDITDRIFVADCLNDAGEYLLVEHQNKAAEPLFKRSLAQREALLEEFVEFDRTKRYIDVSATLSALGRNCLVQKQFGEAQKYLNRALTLMKGTTDPTDWLYCEIIDAYLRSLEGGKLAAPANLKTIPYAFYRKTDFDKPSRWAIFLKSAERNSYAERHEVDCWCKRKDTKDFFEMALVETDKFGKTDMRRAGTLLKYAESQLSDGERKEASVSLNQALEVAASAGSQQLGIVHEVVSRLQGKEKYPSSREDLAVMRSEIAAYKRAEGEKSKHVAALLRNYITKISSNNSFAARWKLQQYEPVMGDIEHFLGLADPLTLEVYSLDVNEQTSRIKFYDAMVMQRKVVAGTKDHYGAKSHEAGVALQKLAQLFADTNDWSGAKQAAEEAKEILGPLPDLEALINYQTTPTFGRPR
jgi:tetratricopeptide (TPR) repeat protein